MMAAAEAAVEAVAAEVAATEVAAAGVAASSKGNLTGIPHYTHV